MDNTYLSSDEPVLVTIHKIIIGGVRHEAVLTGKRLLIGESESGKIVEDILLSALGTVISGENTLREPTLTLTFMSPSGESRAVELVFARQPGGMNIQDRDKIVLFLKDHAVPVTAELTRAEGDTTARLTAQEWMPTSYQDNTGQPAAIIPWKERSPLLTIAVILVILAVFAGVALVYQPPGNGNTTVRSANSTLATTIQMPIVTPSPLPTIEQEKPAVIPEPPAAPGISIPQTGVWVRVNYPGNFTGYVGAQGNSIPVNSTGEQIYAIPVRDGPIEGSIEKQDSSAASLEVGIYQDGALIQILNTTKPAGTVDFHITLPPGTVPAGTIFTPTPVITQPMIPLPDVPLPQAGVWVRVYYPGNFTGSVGYSGFQTPVNSTGDQFYQVPIRTGNILGSIEKQDGSGENLAVAIYKDGALITRLDTAVPRGILYIREMV